MSNRTIKFLLWLVIVALIMACGPSWIASVPPTADPNQVNTFIAQTANAAATQTVAALPTSTLTATWTPTPRNTDTVTPTFTSTVVFILSSPTKPAPPAVIIIGGGTSGSSGSGGSGGGSSTDNYACQIISVSPSNGSTFDPRDDFDTVWRVKNIGQKDWDRNSVDFIYLSGAETYKIAGYDLSQDVDKGQTADLGVDMVAPKDPGTYTTTWTLSLGDNQTFCNMSFTMVVR